MRSSSSAGGAPTWTKLAVIGLTSLLGMSAHAGRPDAWVTTKTKLALWTAAGIPSLEVDVDTMDGIVTLHGKVETADERTAAEREAKKIEGVKSVRNLLQVVSVTRAAGIAKDDKAIKDAIAASLHAANGLGGIEVASVNAGLVLLAGKANDLDDQIRAVRVAYGVPGVRRVASEMSGSDEPYIDDVTEAMDTAAARPATIKRRLSDGWLTTEVKMKLLLDSEIPALDINVDARDGVVTLFGTVPTNAVKAAAEAISSKVAGVKRVTTDLQIVPSSLKKIVEWQDFDTKMAVKRALKSHDALRAVRVDVKGGVARLRGSVPSRLQKLEAILVSRRTDGVRGVSSDLTIKQKKD